MTGRLAAFFVRLVSGAVLGPAAWTVTTTVKTCVRKDGTARQVQA